MAQTARQRQKAQRQKARVKRQRQRQRERTRRQKTRQEMRTRRAEGRQAVRAERVRQKGASGFYSPEGIKARGDVASNLIQQGASVGAMIGTGGLSSLIPSGDRRDKVIDIVDSFSQNEPVSEPAFFGGGGGGSSLAPVEDEKPFYQKPIFIGGALIGSFLLYRSFSRR